ncbi:hypothetical protein [Flavobacterium sp. GSP14]|uniref:hypothetical protein n=1 Tax=Flavobacterium sp. GSP14 TaxID=3401734 RepID=UPI003AAB4126
MIYQYFKTNKNEDKLLKFFKNNPDPHTINHKIKKKISKLTEYQHYSLFCGFIFSKPRDIITKEELSHFVKYKKKRDKRVDMYFPRSNVNTSSPDKLFYLIFDNKKDLYSLVYYYLTTNEYPKQTLITKLLFLKENIQNNFLNSLRTINLTLRDYAYAQKNYDNDNIDTYQYLMEELYDVEQRYKDHIKNIDDRINSFSATKAGSYLVSVDDNILKKIYKGLELYFIDINQTTVQQFITVLKSDWESHNYVIHLKMDNIQFDYLFKLLEQLFNIKMSYANMEYSGNIENKNGKIKASSIYASASNVVKKGTDPKDKDLIKSILEAIK